MRPYGWIRLVSLSMVILATVGNSVRAADDLETQYQKIARETLVKLRVINAKSVGVLKYSVRIGDGKFSSSVGTLNMRLAEQLELALVMANPALQTRSADQVVVVRAASDVANAIEGANHVTPAGRKLLFSKPYPLAWELDGKSTAVPDALIVGVAHLHSDLRKMDIELQLISRRDFELQPLASLTANTDLDDLIDSGESFTTRGLFDDGQVVDENKKVELVAKKSSAIKEETLGKSTSQAARQHPLAPSSNAPIKFEVLYDNQLQSIEFRDGAAFIREPLAGQKVTLIVRRREVDKKRFGILVSVNGENTLFRERLPVSRATLWVLEPNLREFSILGFQIDKGVRQDFRVLSDRDSSKRAIDYGRDVGLISVAVFQEDAARRKSLSEDELDLAVQSQATLPNQTSPTRGALGKSLFDQLLAQDGTRGLIAEGEKKDATVNTVTFNRDLTPVMATSIRYYKPR